MKQAEFNAGQAMRIRIMRAVKASGKEQVFASIIAVAFEVVKDASIAQMRELGGFSNVLEGVINNALNGDVRAFALWNLGGLREALQIKVGEYRSGGEGR